MEDTLKCQNCGYEILNPEGAFCPKCGKPLQAAQSKRCRYCNAILEDGNEKCPGCGRTEKEAEADIKAMTAGEDTAEEHDKDIEPAANVDFDLCKQAVLMLSKDKNPLELITKAHKKAKLKKTPSVKVIDGGIWWVDIANGKGWRIQQNKVSKHFRLLSPELVHQGAAFWENFSKFLSYIIEIGKEN